MYLKLEDKMINLAKIFSLIENKVINLKEGSKLLNYSYWHFTKLYKRYKKVGLKELFKKERKRTKRKLKEKDIELLKTYYLKLDKPQISLLLYFLKIDHPSFPTLSKEWARQILIKEGLYIYKKREKIFRKRFEAEFPGILVQGDSSYEKWIPGDDKYYSLIVFADDCSRFCLSAKIVEKDSVIEHLEMLKNIVKREGKFVSLYYDNDEKYSYIRHKQSRFFEYKKEKADLQVVRALNEVGINVINSRPFDPCGKGKIERLIETFQLQLPVWFKKFNVNNFEKANVILKKYIKYYNCEQFHREINTTPYLRFSSLSCVSKFQKVKDLNLDKIFSLKFERVASKDNTLRFNGLTIQLKKSPHIPTFAGKKIEIRISTKNQISLFYNSLPINYEIPLPLNDKNMLKFSCIDNEKLAIL